MICEFSVILSTEDNILVLYPLKDIDYFVRAYIPHDKNKSTDWELVSQCGSAVKHMTNVEYLFNCSEEELFQESCTVPYDVYYVLSAMKFMKNYIDSTETLFRIHSMGIELEY